jgi:predicted ATP-dependent Lon-type protease
MQTYCLGNRQSKIVLSATGVSYILYRLQVSASPGSNRFVVMGITSRAIKESARMAYDYLRANRIPENKFRIKLFL